MAQGTAIKPNGDSPRMSAASGRPASGSQTLLRGIEVLESVGEGPASLGELAARLGFTRSTTHRLANALVDRRYLTFVPGRGYQLGPKLFQLAFQAQQQTDLAQIARPRLEKLAEQTEDTIHLGVLDMDCALYLDEVPGRRRIAISSRVGDRQPLTSTGLGKALLFDEDAKRWKQLFERDQRNSKIRANFKTWLSEMKDYVQSGRSYELEENGDHVRGVAAPIRDASGAISAAISISSAAQYMTDARMAELSKDVMETAAAISSELGWTTDAEALGLRVSAATDSGY